MLLRASHWQELVPLHGTELCEGRCDFWFWFQSFQRQKGFPCDKYLKLSDTQRYKTIHLRSSLHLGYLQGTAEFVPLEIVFTEIFYFWYPQEGKTDNPGKSISEDCANLCASRGKQENPFPEKRSRKDKEENRG